MIEMKRIEIINLGNSERPLLEVRYFDEVFLQWVSLFNTTSADEMLAFIRDRITWI